MDRYDYDKEFMDAFKRGAWNTGDNKQQIKQEIVMKIVELREEYDRETDEFMKAIIYGQIIGKQDDLLLF